MKYKYTVSKAVLIIALGIFLAFLCGTGNYKSVTPEEFQQAYQKEESISGLLLGDNKKIRQFYGIEENQVETYILYYAKETMAVDELLIMQAKDSEQMVNLEDSVKKRNEEQRKSFEGYGTNQTQLLNDYQLVIKGKYLFYAVGEESENWKKVFMDLIKK